MLNRAWLTKRQWFNVSLIHPKRIQHSILLVFFSWSSKKNFGVKNSHQSMLVECKIKINFIAFNSQSLITPLPLFATCHYIPRAKIMATSGIFPIFFKFFPNEITTKKLSKLNQFIINQRNNVIYLSIYSLLYLFVIFTSFQGKFTMTIIIIHIYEIFLTFANTYMLIHICIPLLELIYQSCMHLLMHFNAVLAFAITHCKYYSAKQYSINSMNLYILQNICLLLGESNIHQLAYALLHSFFRSFC